MTKKRTPSDNASQDAPDLYTGEAPLDSAQQVWTQVSKELIYALGPNVHRSWTGQLSVTDACAFSVTLSAPSRFIASKINTQYLDDVRRLFEKHDRVAPPRQIVIAQPGIGAALQNRKAPRGGLATAKMPGKPMKTRGTYELSDAKLAGHSDNAPTLPLPYGGRGLDSPRDRFTFDNFVVGGPNEFAFAVARQIAATQTEGREPPQYNPVVIHGANGIGKTHLLQAVRQHINTQNPERSLKLISSEEFVSAFVTSVRGKERDGIESFKASLREVDVLIIDDAHFIADKRGSREELLHTLISLVDEGRQVLIATDRHPDELEEASARLKSYLCSGLVCKVGAADYELRLRILDRLIARRRETANAGLAIPQNARDHLAARINATPRDLEGAFNQVVAQSELLGTPITLETIQVTLSDSRYAKGMRLTVDKIQRAVADEFGITLNDMTSKRRARDIARPRQVAMYLCKKLTKRSLPDIGRRFGGRDHTTVMHAVKRVDQLRGDDSIFNARVKAVETALKG